MTASSQVLPIAQDILRLRAANAAPLTGSGTNTYVLRGQGGAVLIDPGPDLDAHIAAIVTSLGDLPLQGILVTHAHLDHSGAGPKLAAQTGAAIYSFGPAAQRGGPGAEGSDLSHQPDRLLHDGAQICLAGLRITAHHTPGHMHGHLCFGLRDMLFSGDHVMGWATSLVAPHEGDMADYRASLAKLCALPYTRYLPGHGEAIEDPPARLAYLIQHRNQREAQILAALQAGAANAIEIAARIYTDTPPALLPAAAQNVLAHLLELAKTGQVHAPQSATPASLFALP